MPVLRAGDARGREAGRRPAQARRRSAQVLGVRAVSGHAGTRPEGERRGRIALAGRGRGGRPDGEVPAVHRHLPPHHGAARIRAARRRPDSPPPRATRHVSGTANAVQSEGPRTSAGLRFLALKRGVFFGQDSATVVDGEEWHGSANRGWSFDRPTFRRKSGEAHI